MPLEQKKEDLDQYDYIDSEYLDSVEEEYTDLIGQFLIGFSHVEHSLNVALAELIGNSGSHYIGYVVIEELLMGRKIDLFRRLYLSLTHFQSEEGKTALTALHTRLVETNAFRNVIAHANWPTLDAESFVRTKIQTKNDDGLVEFRKVKVTPEIIETAIEDAISLSDDLDEFSEKALGFEFEKEARSSN